MRLHTFTIGVRKGKDHNLVPKISKHNGLGKEREYRREREKKNIQKEQPPEIHRVFTIGGEKDGERLHPPTQHSCGHSQAAGVFSLAMKKGVL